MKPGDRVQQHPEFRDEDPYSQMVWTLVTKFEHPAWGEHWFMVSDEGDWNRSYEEYLVLERG